MIDSHLHLWDTGRFRYPWLDGPLDRPFLPEHLDAGDSDVTGAVLVRAETVPEQGLDEAGWLAGLDLARPRVWVGEGTARRVDGLAEVRSGRRARP